MNTSMEVRKINKNKPRIVLLIDSWLSSNEDRVIYVNQLAKKLVEEQGYEVDIFARGVREKPQEKLDGLRVHVLPPFLFGPLSFLWLVVFGRRYQLMHAHGVRSAIAMKLSSWINWKPTVLTVHDHRVFSNLLNPKTYLQRIVLLETNYTQQISISEAFLKARNINKQVLVIPPGVDCTPFDALEATKVPEQFIALFVGRMSNSNGVDLLLQATKKLLEDSDFIRSHKDFRLELLGDGPYLKNFKTIAEKLKIDSFVRFRKWPSDETLLKYYKASDLFVLPARTAALPYRALQACAAGLPILATKTGDLKLLVLENQNGHLVEPNDVDELAYYLQHFVLNPHLEKMGDVSRSLVEQEFTWEKTIQRHLNLYRALSQRKTHVETQPSLLKLGYTWLKYRFFWRPKKLRTPLSFRFSLHLDDQPSEIAPFLERLTEFCSHLGLPATFFVKASQIEAFSAELQGLADSGYPLGVLTDDEDWNTLPNRKKHIRALRELLNKHNLSQVKLFRSGTTPEEEDLDYLQEHGFEYCPISEDPLPQVKWFPLPKVRSQKLNLKSFLDWKDEDLLNAVQRFRNADKKAPLNFQCSSREFESNELLPHASGENFTHLSKKLSVLRESFEVDFI